jgi:predicted nucleotidyltransferase
MVLDSTLDYRLLAESLKAQLLTEVCDQIHSIVLYGSVASGDTDADSDVDLLLITDGSHHAKVRIYDLASDAALENEVVVETTVVALQDFENEVRMRSWFSTNVIREGIVLHDDGSYRRIRGRVSRPVAGVPDR